MLLLEIFHLLLSTVAGLLGSALLLRVYLGWLRVSRSNPLAIFCVALTEWLVAPLRRALPARGRFDAASLAAALSVALVFVLLMGLVRADRGWHWYLFVPSVVLVLIHWVLYLVTLLVLANVLLSLVNPHAPLAPTLDVLTRPVLAPLRRIIPPVGGFDLSPLVLIVVVQVLLLVLGEFPI
ncbi:Membrane protein [Burkholderiales bacterium]|nr:Membrane protein [Burkholderiales bacterium]